MQKFWQNIFKHLDRYRTIHSIKTAIACLLGLALIKYFNWPQGWWVPITIIVVMSAQTRFGGTLQKAYMRFLGTAGGLTIALLTLTFFDNNIVAVFTAIAIACLISTYIASGGGNISYAGVLGGVTTVLILAGPNAGEYFALQRGLYIIVGIIIALLVSRFVLPLHARERVLVSVSDTLRNLQNLYFIIAQRKLERMDKNAEDKLANKLIDLIREQPNLIDEASLGSRYFSQHKSKLFKEIYNTERRLYRLINLMNESLEKSGEFIEFMHKSDSIEEINLIIENSLADLAEVIIRGDSLKNKLDIADINKKLETTWQNLPNTKDLQKIIGEHSFIFFMQQIAKEIAKLQEITGKISELKS